MWQSKKGDISHKVRGGEKHRGGSIEIGILTTVSLDKK